MFESGPNYPKLKTNLRLAVNRLKLLEKKKTELALKARKEIADYIAAGKAERGIYLVYCLAELRLYSCVSFCSKNSRGADNKGGLLG